MLNPQLPLLALENVSAGYKDLVILEKISFRVAEGETLCVIGRNGMGKTTLLASIMGLTRFRHGRIVFGGADISCASTMERSRRGIGFVPQEREVFQALTVEENLAVANSGGDYRMEHAYALFPRLAERRRHLGRQLSGGEQQMLSIARALMTDPKLLLLDEPSEGLAPVIVDEVFNGLETLRRESRLTVVLVEQHVSRALGFAPRAIAVRNGRVVYDGPSDAIREDAVRLDQLVGLAAT